MPQRPEVRVAHPVGVVLEVAQGGVAGRSALMPARGKARAATADRGDVAVVELASRAASQSSLAVAEHEGQQSCRGRAGARGRGTGPRSGWPRGSAGWPGSRSTRAPSPRTTSWRTWPAPRRRASAAIRVPNAGGGREGGQVAGGARVADRVAVLIDAGLGERAGQLHLAGAGLAVLALAGPALGLGRHHRHAGAVDGDVQHVRQRPGGRQRDQRAGGDRGGPRLDHGGGCPRRRPRRAGPARLPVMRDPGQLADQRGAAGERHRRGRPGGHLAQPRRHASARPCPARHPAGARPCPQAAQ